MSFHVCFRMKDWRAMVELANWYLFVRMTGYAP